MISLVLVEKNMNNFLQSAIRNNSGMFNHPISIEQILNHISQRGPHIPLSVINAILPSNQHKPVTDFVYQLVKMLAENKYPNVISWHHGEICVHDPPTLANTVLHQYFRHNNFASFQRQLNYFGFRKRAGKFRLSPCTYYHSDTTNELQSLFFIKRKNNSNDKSKSVSYDRHKCLSIGPVLSIGTSSQIQVKGEPNPLSDTKVITCFPPTPSPLPYSPTVHTEESDCNKNHVIPSCDFTRKTIKTPIQHNYQGDITLSTSQMDCNPKPESTISAEDSILDDLADIFSEQAQDFPLVATEVVESNTEVYHSDSSQDGNVQYPFYARENESEKLSREDSFFDIVAVLLDPDEEDLSNPFEPTPLDQIISRNVNY